MSALQWHDYDYALIRLVPRVHLGECVNVGVILHARTAGYLGVRILTDPGRRLALVGSPQLSDLVRRHLLAYERIVLGGEQGGEIGMLPPSERFHWLTAPRSAVLQTSELHYGRTTNPAGCLDRLFRNMIGGTE